MRRHNQDQPFESQNSVSGIETLKIQNHEMKKTLFESKERYYEELVANCFEGVWLVEFDPPIDTKLSIPSLVEAMLERARIMTANDSMARMYGFQRSNQIEGRYCKEWFLKTPQNMDILRSFVQNNFRLSNVIAKEKDEKGNTIYIENTTAGIMDGQYLVGTWGVQRDVTAGKKMEQAREYSLKIEQAMGRISSHFLTVENLDQCINEALREAGMILQVSRAYLFQASEDGTKGDNTHEWVAPGVTPQIHNMQGMEASSFPWWMEQMIQNKVISVSDVNQLPEPERTMLKQQDIISILVIPIYSGENLVGFFGFDETKQKREWLPEEITFLRTVSEILARFLELEKSRQALKESEEKFQLFQSSVFDVIYRYDPINNKYDFISPSIESQTGYSVSEFVSNPIGLAEFITHPEDWLKVQVEVRNQITAGPPGKPFRMEYRITRQDGTEIWVSDQKTLEFSEDGKLRRINGVVHDVTQMKQAEEALRESEAKSRALLTVLPDMMFRFKRDGTFLDFKAARKEELLVSPHHFLGKKVHEVLPVEIAQPTMHCIEQALQTGETQLFEYSLTMGDSVRHYEARLVASGDDEVLTIVRDITERKRIERKLKKYTQKMNEKNRELKAKNHELSATRAQLVQKEKLRALGQMASGMAHDFNNFLAVILGRTQLLRKKTDDLEMEKGLSIIENATQDAAFTVKRIQDFARVRKDQEFKWVDVDDLIKDVIAMTKIKWKDQAEALGVTIKLRVEKDHGKHPLAIGDASELREVLTNLIFNAVEAMTRGGELVIKTWTDRKSVIISVGDTGTGMQEEVKRKIFDPFFTTKGVKNNGLGLSVAYGIIQRHGGDIWAESNLQTGTTMVIRLPIRSELEKLTDEKQKFKHPTGSDFPADILLIEDDEEIRQLLFDILSPEGYRVIVSSSGPEGLKLCRANRFDLVITDLGMPEMSGWKVTEEIKKIKPNIPVLLLTGWGTELDQEKLKKSHIDQVIPKPIQVDSLLKIVGETLESKKMKTEQLGSVG